MAWCDRVRGKPKTVYKVELEVEMKRFLFVIATLMLLLCGCKSAEPEPQAIMKVYTAKTELGDGLHLEEKWTIEGMDNDYLTRTTMTYTYCFDDLEAWDSYLTELKAVLDQRIGELQGPQGSRYIIMEYKMDGNLLVVSEVTDYEAASKNDEAVMRNDKIESGEYYSMSKLCENFDLQKYTLQD